MAVRYALHLATLSGAAAVIEYDDRREAMEVARGVNFADHGVTASVIPLYPRYDIAKALVMLMPDLVR